MGSCEKGRNQWRGFLLFCKGTIVYSDRPGRSPIVRKCHNQTLFRLKLKTPKAKIPIMSERDPVSAGSIRRRCEWAGTDNNSLMVQYHDNEWGVPVHDDRTLFEFLTLEGAQAGLSWQTVLNKRQNYRRAFNGFDVSKIADYGKRDAQRLLLDPGIIRNRLKINTTIINAKKFLEIQDESGTFDSYVWRFVGGKPITHRPRSLGQIPSTTKESDDLSSDLRRRGFKFVGSTICYAFMQAVGLVNDHTTSCYRFKQLAGLTS
jgi:DNA-3-methyladenine glycosylase I